MYNNHILHYLMNLFSLYKKTLLPLVYKNKQYCEGRLNISMNHENDWLSKEERRKTEG